MFSVIMLNVLMLSVIMLSVVETYDGFIKALIVLTLFTLGNTTHLEMILFELSCQDNQGKGSKMQSL